MPDTRARPRYVTWAAIVMAGLLSTYLLAGAVIIFRLPIDNLIVCANHGGFVLPYSRAICEMTFYRRNLDARELEVLHAGIGASSVLGNDIPLERKEKLLRHLVSSGLDPNRIDVHGLTPLHGAVLENSVEDAAVLLRYGADRSRVDRVYGKTALELAVELQARAETRDDRRALIALLNNRR